MPLESGMWERQWQKPLQARFRTIDDLINADTEQLTGVNEIGPKIAASIVAYFSDKENLEMIKRLKSAGIRFSNENESVKTGNSFWMVKQ